MTRVRKSSEQSNVTDSDAGDQASYEYSADSLLSDSDKVDRSTTDK